MPLVRHDLSRSCPVLTRVIELSSLANGKSTASNHQYFLDVDQVLAAGNMTTFEVCLGVRSDLSIAGCTAELVETVQ